MPEHTEQKINELNQQLAAARKERDELNNEAKSWAEKRTQIHEQTKTLHAEIKSLREKRDETNLQVQVLKAKRETAKTQRKEKLEQILKLREKLEALAPKKPLTKSKDLEKEIQELEWKIQTTSIPVKEEKKLIDQVRVLETQLAVHKQLQELREKLIERQTEAKVLETQAKLSHEKLSELAAQSQKYHEQLQQELNNARVLRRSADEAHQKHLEFRQKADATHQKYLEIQQKITLLKGEVKKKEKEEYTKRGQVLMEEATRKAQEKMKRGEKLTWEEFKLLTEHEEATEH